MVKKKKKLRNIFNDLRYATFGILLPSEYTDSESAKLDVAQGGKSESEEDTDTTDMPELEDEKPAAERQQGQGLKNINSKTNDY